MQEMRERFGDDRQRMSQEMMKLLQRRKVIHLAVAYHPSDAIALYWTFMEAVELRHAPFFGWVQDLSAQDLLSPNLNGRINVLVTKLSPTSCRSNATKGDELYAVIFTFFFLWFPAGLVLYWCV